MTGWRAVRAVMQAAGLAGVPPSPKGLRHGSGVAAVTAGIPLNLVQKWLGHTPSSAPPPSMPMRSERRKRTSPGACGGKPWAWTHEATDWGRWRVAFRYRAYVIKQRQAGEIDRLPSAGRVWNGTRVDVHC